MTTVPADLLEARGGLLRTRPASAMIFSALWALSLLSFALVRSYPLAIGLLFAAGFFELSSSSMNQTIVQMNAPDAIRGRVLGLECFPTPGHARPAGGGGCRAGSLEDRRGPRSPPEHLISRRCRW